MGRCPRVLVDGEHYHIVQRGNNKKDVFHEAEDFSRYVSTIGRYLHKYAVALQHYCLMPNHIHLLLKAGRGKDLPLFMHDLNRSYASYYKKKYDHRGSLWQGPYKNVHIMDDAQLLACARYIERNPLVAGIVHSLRDYPFSSFAHYAYGEKSWIISESRCYRDFGSGEERHHRYRKFVEDGPDISSKMQRKMATCLQG